MTASSGLTASSSNTAWYERHHHRHHQQQQQHLLTSSLYNITSADITAPTTIVASLGSRTSLIVSWIRIVLLTLCTLGVLFNCFVLFVLLHAKQSRRVSSKMLIINQTVADLLGCLSIIVNAVTTTHIREYMKLPGAIVICIIFESSSMISICNNASIINLVLLTLERYCKIAAVCKVYHLSLIVPQLARRYITPSLFGGSRNAT